MTCETYAVETKPGDEAYAGSAVKQGEGDGLVIATGANTVFGKVIGLEPPPPRKREAIKFPKG